MAQTINKKSFNYDDLIITFGKDVLVERYALLYDYIIAFIERSGYKKNVYVSVGILNQAVVDYFSDIYRLKTFHQIEHINFIKIHAYTAYWLMRRKPIQIIKEDPDDVELPFINEKFVTSYLVRFLHADHEDIRIIKEDRPNYIEFIKNLEYLLRYRTVTAQTLETILEAHRAGAAFDRSII